MSSSEEYLDSLLRSLTEGQNDPFDDHSSAAQDTAETQTAPVPEDPGKMMSEDDIEALFASMEESSAPKEQESSEGMTSDAAETLQEASATADAEPGPDTMGLQEAEPDEADLAEAAAMDELALDDLGMTEDEGLNAAETDFGGPAFDDLGLDDLGLTEAAENAASDDVGMAEPDMPEDELNLDALSLDDLGLDDLGLEDLGLAENAASEEEEASAPTGLDDLHLDDLGLSDLAPEEGAEAEADFALEEGADTEADFALEESADAEADFALEEGAEAEADFALEESADAEEHFALEEDADAEEHFALEESGEEDAELSALLESMGGSEDLSAINDLLEKSEQGVNVDDDMMAMLGDMPEQEDGGEFDFFAGEEEEMPAEEGEPEDIREITQEELDERENPKSKKDKKKEEKEKKKREKLAKKAKKTTGSQEEAAAGDDLSGLLESMDAEHGESSPKKQGFFAKLLEFLLEEDEDEEADAAAESGTDDLGVVIGNLSDENKELLAELKAEDQKKSKKDKKEKKKKGAKGKKKADAAASEDGEEEEGKSAKAKKPKKEKKKKKEENVEEEPKTPEKKISKKKVVSVFLFCATIAACIIVFTTLLPGQFEKQEARVAFDHAQYEQVYELLYGKKLSEEDEALLTKSSIVLQMQRKLDSYENYSKMDMPLEALDALMEGISRYQELREAADANNVGGEVADIYGQILDALADDYGLSEAEAMDILAAGDNVTYSQYLQAVLSGEAFREEGEQPEGRQDVLPEEEEIIDRLEGTETE